jgi:hypothetical protein
MNNSYAKPSRKRTRARRCIGILSAVVLALAGAIVATGPAVSGTVPPFTIGPANAADVPDAGADFLDDPQGNVKELGPLNSNTTKIGVIHNDALPTLGLTNPNANVDLRGAWLDTAKDADGDDWLYFAWERDSNNGSGFIAYEFMHNAAPAGCDYGANNATLIADCNPWANRTAGDFIILWDQQGNSTDLYLRTWSGTAPNLTLGAPTLLNASVSAAAYSADRFRGEAAVNLTDAIFGGATGCITFANTIPSTVTGNSDTADYKDTILQQIPPITNCGSVKINKNDDSGNPLDGAVFTLYKDNAPTGGTRGVEDTITTKTCTTVAGTCTISDVLFGAYWVVETTTPPGYDSADDQLISVVDTTVVELTFVDVLQQGALVIVKNSTKGGAVANAGAVFSYDSSSVTDNGTGDDDPAIGSVCVSGLSPGDYTVNETTAPDGYGDAPASQADQTVTVVVGTNCTDKLPGAGATATFTNAPLADIQVNVRDGGSGETSATSITCDDSGTETTTPPLGWDSSVTHSDIPIDPSPVTITCTIVIDP